MRFSTTTATISLMACYASSSASASSSSVLGGANHIIRPPRNPDVMMRMLKMKEKNNNAKNPAVGDDGDGSGQKKSKARASPMLDYNHHNIHLDRLEYTYGSPIQVSFELTNDLPIAKDVLMNLDVSKMEDWSIGIFMRMADPQGGALRAIATVKPTISNLGATAPPAPAARALRRGRELQGAAMTIPETPAAPNATDALLSGVGYEAIANMPPVDSAPPVLNYAGSAVIPAKTTSPAVLDPEKFGTGYDLFLLDEDGAAIIGPATFYLVATKAMNDAIAAETERVPNAGVAKFDDARKQIKLAKVEKEEGKGSGRDDKHKYDNFEEDPATVGLGTGADGKMIIATTPKLADYVLNTTQEYYNTEDNVVVSYDIGSGFAALGGRRRMQNGHDKDKVTTIAVTTTVNGGPPPAPISPPEPDAIELITDPTDISLFSMGVYMRMANPQDGKLPPLLSVPFCSSDGQCNKTDEQLKKGTIEFDASVLDIPKNGFGYDVWILNGAGAGVAGPKTFYIINSLAEESEL